MRDLEKAKEELESRKMRLKSKVTTPTQGKCTRREYDEYTKARMESAIEIRSRLESTFLEYEKQALARHEFEAASAYARAAALVIGTCTSVGGSLSSQDDEI